MTTTTPMKRDFRNYIRVSELIRDDFYSFSLCNVGDLSRSLRRRGGFKVQKEKGKLIITRSRSPLHLDCGHFTSLFGRGRQRNEPKLIMHVQSQSFAY